MTKARYELKCTDDMSRDLHTVLVYDVNPRLFDLANKVGVFTRPNTARELNEWINEDDDAHIELVHTEYGKTLEELFVDTLFNLRDSLIANKIDLNTFRRHFAELVALAVYRRLNIANDLIGLLSTLGCSISFLPTEITGVEVEQRPPPREAKPQEIKARIRDKQRPSPSSIEQRIMENLETLASTKPEEMVRVETLVLAEGERLPGCPLTVRITTPRGGRDRVMEYTITTDKNGIAAIAVPEYSTLEIIAPMEIVLAEYGMKDVSDAYSNRVNVGGRVLKIIVPNREMRLTLWLNKPREHTHATLAIVLIILIIFILLILAI